MRRLWPILCWIQGENREFYNFCACCERNRYNFAYKFSKWRFKIKNYTQKELANFLNDVIEKIYYGYWQIDETKYPILNHTVAITYRIPNFYMPKEPLTSGFYHWTRQMIKQLAIKHGDRKWVYARQPVGMYAMDYEGSRTGKFVDGKVGPHVHALLVVHPELKESVEWELDVMQTENMTFRKKEKKKKTMWKKYIGEKDFKKPEILHLNHQELEPVYKFYWAPHNKMTTIEHTVGYNLKGIMHPKGYWSGREDQWGVIFPDPQMPVVNKPNIK